MRKPVSIPLRVCYLQWMLSAIKCNNTLNAIFCRVSKLSEQNKDYDFNSIILYVFNLNGFHGLKKSMFTTVQYSIVLPLVTKPHLYKHLCTFIPASVVTSLLYHNTIKLSHITLIKRFQHCYLEVTRINNFMLAP